MPARTVAPIIVCNPDASRVDYSQGWTECEIVPGQSITVRLVTQGESDGVFARCHAASWMTRAKDGTDRTEPIRRMIDSLSRAESLELGGLAFAAATAEGEDMTLRRKIVGDWLEDRGHDRELAIFVGAKQAYRLEESSKTFFLGQSARYGGYNLDYYGPILSITGKTVTVSHGHGDDTKSRMRIGAFALENWNFDLAVSMKRNAEWMD